MHIQTHTHVVCVYIFPFIYSLWYLGLVLQAFLLTSFSWVSIMGHFASCSKVVLEDVWPYLFCLEMKNCKASFHSYLPTPLCQPVLTWCDSMRQYQGHSNSFWKSPVWKASANIHHLLNTNFNLKMFGRVINNGRNTCQKNVSCVWVWDRWGKGFVLLFGVGVGEEEMNHCFSGSSALPRLAVICTLFSSLSKDEEGISQQKI